MPGAVARRLALLVALCAFGGSSSCVPVDGGAVEASWRIRSEDGRAISSCDCADPLVARIRLRVVAAGAGGAARDVCAGRSECEFPCGQHTGATKFDLPPGPYDVSVVPLDAAGADLTQAAAGRRLVTVPTPRRRDVVDGQLAQLPAFLVVTGCADRCGGDDRRKICGR